MARREQPMIHTQKYLVGGGISAQNKKKQITEI